MVKKEDRIDFYEPEILDEPEEESALINDTNPGEIEEEHIEKINLKNTRLAKNTEKPIEEPVLYQKPKKWEDFKEKPVILEKQKLKEEKKRFNEDIRVKENGVMLINKKTIYILLGIIAIFSIAFLIFAFQFNFSFAKLVDKDFSMTYPLNNTVENHYNIPVNVEANSTSINNNQYTIQLNATIVVPNAKFYINQSG